MQRKKRNSRGFTLIPSLMLMMLFAGISIGLLMMVNTEVRVGGNDLQNNLAFHASEGAIERMTSQLANTFQNIQAPSAADITALNGTYPTGDPTTTYPDYTFTPATNPDGSLASTYGLISSGPNAGLYAQIIPVTLHATAQKPLGEQVSMFRTVEVALIPVFQFGVFSDGDLGFFSSPQLDFNGRVHTNGDLYLGVSNGTTLTFHDKLTAYGNVIRATLPNGVDATSSGNNDQGTVLIPTAAQGCDNTQPYCRAIAQTEGSVVKGPTSAYNNGPPSWNTVSTGTYNGYITDGDWGNSTYGTGVKSLSLPFVGGGAQPYEIIRRPPLGEITTSPLGASRLGNQAQIRVMFSDKQADLHLGDWNGDPSQDIQLGGGGTGDPSDTTGLTVNGTAGYYWAWANSNTTYGAVMDPNGSTKATFDADFVPPPGYSAGSQWPLIGGWLLVEVQEADGKWHGVTKEWLSAGFARGLDVPNSEKGVVNTVHQNAILILQEIADRNGDKVITNGKIGATNVYENTNSKGSPYNWFPINLYDAREGENWDSTAYASSCTPNGVMNAVEIDVGNLNNWLDGKFGATGKLVDWTQSNGYILYYSDRRGMQYKAGNANLIGEYGWEDTINLANNGVPDKALEPALPGKKTSPEDANSNGALDTYGVAHVGDAFGSAFATATNSSSPNPYSPRITTCYTTGRKNRVTGARHVLKLVNGTLGNLPTKPDGTGGFTVGSENPVYIQGNYNTSAADPTWSNPNATDPAHAAAAVIADAVTLLSINWQDAGYPNYATGIITGSLNNTATSGAKNAATTYYRVAIAAGKSQSFWNPNGTPTEYFGTDGGLHNFLRFLENWPGTTLYYKGSLVSLFWSTQATGTFKCCTTVYNPPTRNYVFDPLFAQPANLPPGTPMFRDVDNLSYRQDFTARSN
jgi:hypothetical protein